MSEQESPEANFSLTGDEARLLMAALIQVNVSMNPGHAISLWMRLNQVAQVQPPTQQPS